MSVIGTFMPAKDGGWTGSIHTLTINTKVRLVPNDNRDNENAPVFRVFVGQSRVGDAWAARSGGDSPKDYLRVRLDDPSLPETHQRRPVPVRRRQRGAARVEPAEGREQREIGFLSWNRIKAWACQDRSFCVQLARPIPSCTADGRHVAGESSTSLAGSERVRRHPRRRARSAPKCGVSAGPRAYRVRVPMIIIRQQVSRRCCRSRRSTETRSDIPHGCVRANAQSAGWRAAWRHSLSQRLRCRLSTP